MWLRENGQRKGPMMAHSNVRDLAGHRNGRLVAVRPAGRSNDGHVLWECRCDCGRVIAVRSHSPVRKSGGTRSCGCLRREVSSRKKRIPWNSGLSYSTGNGTTERIYRQKHSWAKAALLKHGNGCSVCGWSKARCDVHHRVSRRHGGQLVLSNAVVLCPNCHRVMHEASNEVH